MGERNPNRLPDPTCRVCRGKGYTEESHGMEGPWRERVGCNCCDEYEPEEVEDE